MPSAPCSLPHAICPLTGILLAGGKSSRMGQEKGLVELRGKPLIQYGIDLLSGFTDTILIGSSNPAYLPFGLEMVPDEIMGKGPVAGLATLLKRSNTPWNLVLACDLPFLQPELILALLEAAGTNHAVIPVSQGIAEPLAGLYHSDLAEYFQLEIAKGNLALHKILQSCKVHYLETDELVLKYPKLFTNFNSLKEMDQYL
jgi:molybdopterin-guanine dinucleotide biosynthesis protein A